MVSVSLDGAGTPNTDDNGDDAALIAGGSPLSGAGAAPADAKQGGSSVMEASFNFINSIVGAGLIGIPFAFNEAGLGMGLLLLVRRQARWPVLRPAGARTGGRP